ncbi:CBF/Mak21 family-domain-containing protein [Lasiosphaeria miniovina]|uniref:CBF/Mak21 family-domain-containing protein n=1 Tax=Lasiosphaeria miniovina TaxID=1954250 RepID=A0AA40AJP7_9PEZI|nr:CBF/Mak21 family-domain-containing protein [Lasiosphaeria miniovina]KAK0717000.1 CBF/Mak21 family-domain-containing protein [Lasiosphaeria miniovina]
MPAATREGGDKPVTKRKRPENGEPSKKRRKSGKGVDNDLASQIQVLESEILESKKHYNNIATLTEIAAKQEDDIEAALAAAEALGRVFVRLLVSGSLVRRQDASEKDATVTAWLRDHFAGYEAVLLSKFQTNGPALKALMLSMAVLKAEAQHLDGRDEATFPRSSFKKIINALIQSPLEELRQAFYDNFIAEYDDIRFYTFQAIADILSEEGQPEDETFRSSVFGLLLRIEDVPGSNEELSDFYVDPPAKKKHPLYLLSQHKKQAQEAWLAFINLGLSKGQRKKILQIMATSIAPWFTKPELFMDFLTDCYNSGGSISLLALSGVFYLIQERNLDYPLFYRKLYSLLDADILHSKHRSRFFRLLDTFLSSSHLPAVLVASFIKRLARLSLNAPPSAIAVIVPWYYNLFKKHPLCTFMMHRVPRTKEEKELIESEGVLDPFLPDEEDPMETRALDSCLWEIVQLQSHYHPNIATIAKIISEQFTKQSYNLEDFLDHSYGSLLEAEMIKNIRKPPVVEFMIPKHIFTDVGPTAAPEEKDSLLVSLWDFGSS